MTNKILWRKRISIRLTAIMLLIAILPVVVTNYIAVKSAQTALEKLEFQELHLVGEIQANQIKAFFTRKIRDLEFLAKSVNAIDALNKLKAYHDAGGATVIGTFNESSPAYLKLYNEIDPFFRTYVKEYNFHNLLFISAEHGDVIYSVTKNKDFGTSLKTGEYKSSSLAKLWKMVVNTEKTSIVDFSYYEPSGENDAFIATPVFTNSGDLLAVLVLELNSDKINEIMNEASGMGETGESYIVGQDYLMRSDSRFSSESTVLKQKVKTKSVELSLQHQEGSHIIENYRGVKVLSYYEHLGLDDALNTDFEWVIISEIEEEEAFASLKTLTSEIFLIGLIILIIAGLVAIFFSKLITNPIVYLERATRLLADGDLSQEIEIKSKDEIGQLANSFKDLQFNMQEKMKTQVAEMSDNVNILSSSTSEIMAMISELASTSAETATSVSETTTTIEEVKQTAEVSVQKANEVSETAQKISMISKDGKKSVEKTIDGMNKIKHQMESIASIVIQLSEKSNTIGEIANNVNDLAEQSNLLAVNASIEAAKAGEQGKGFSVVAQEIKNLAKRSKDSTVQIRTILSDIQKEITSAVMATEQGGKAIDAGLELSSKASEVISMLAAGVEQTSEANIHIAASSQQQLTGMDQIATAMENIKEASIQASEGTLQAEESVSELKKLGEKLLHSLNQNRVD